MSYTATSGSFHKDPPVRAGFKENGIFLTVRSLLEVYLILLSWNGRENTVGNHINLEQASETGERPKTLVPIC